MASRSALFVGLDSSGNGLTPADGRRALGAMYGTTARPLLVPSWTGSSSNMQITVAQNVWQLPDPTDSASTFISPMDSFVVTPAAGPSSGSRIDSIVIKQDNPQNGDPDPYTVPSLIAGTTAPPAIPVGYYEVARVTVPAGVSNATGATVQFLFPAGLAPAAIMAQSSASLSTITGTVIGQIAYVGTTEFRWDGTNWRPWSSLWTSYTPSINWTGGSGSALAFRSKYQNGDVRVRGRATMGSSPTIPSFFTVSLPALDPAVLYAPLGVYGAQGTAMIGQRSTGGNTLYQGLLSSLNASTNGTADTTRPDSIRVWALGTNGAAGNVSSLFTWGSTDYFELDAVIPIGFV